MRSVMQLLGRAFVLTSLFFSIHATAATLETPLEECNFSQLTSYAELMKYLRRLDAGSDVVSVRSIGRSVQHRDIPALLFTEDTALGSNRDRKPIVLIYCQQHGDEPSGKEGALLAARELLGPKRSLLKDLDLVLVPLVNPDGAEAGTRANANDADLNRDHLMLIQPETEALHQLFLHWMPEVTVDLHEYNVSQPKWFAEGFIVDADIMADGVTNRNISSRICAFSDNLFVPQVVKRIADSGYRAFRYTVGGPPSVKRLRHSTLNINDGRQSMGIYGTLSFIVEGTQYADITADLRRRAQSQCATVLAFLETIAEHRQKIIDLVHTTRKEISADPTMQAAAAQPRQAYIRMDYAPDPERPLLREFPVFDLYSWQATEKDLGNYEPRKEILQSVVKPVAYIVPPTEKRLIELLKRHHIAAWRMPENRSLEIETYTIVSTKRTTEEDKPGEEVTVTKTTGRQKLSRGSLVVPLNQPAGILLPLMLEPQSSWGICTERSGRTERFVEYLTFGREYPIQRLLEHPGIDFSPVQIDHLSEKLEQQVGDGAVERSSRNR